VRNTGPTTVTITGARLDRAGAKNVPISKPVATGTTAELNVPIEDACPSTLPPAPTGVLLTLLTVRQQKTPRASTSAAPTSRPTTTRR
jgi:hypothetical protein